jgi:hypothetical protein
MSTNFNTPCVVYSTTFLSCYYFDYCVYEWVSYQTQLIEIVAWENICKWFVWLPWWVCISRCHLLTTCCWLDDGYAWRPGIPTILGSTVFMSGSVPNSFRSTLLSYFSLYFFHVAEPQSWACGNNCFCSVYLFMKALVQFLLKYYVNKRILWFSHG